MDKYSKEEEDGIEKKLYEVSFLVRAEADAEQLRKLILQHDAEITHDGGMRKIAPTHKITKDEFLYFGFYRISAFPSAAKLMEHDFGSSQVILRSMIVIFPDSKAEPSSGRSFSNKSDSYQRDRRDESISSIGGGAYEQRKTDVLSNEALEKKIEEILK